MSLLKITTTPIEYEIKVERAKLQKKDIDPTDLKDYTQQVRNHSRVGNVQNDAAKLQQIKQSNEQAQNYQNLARSRTSGRAVSTPANEIINNSSSASQAVSSSATPTDALVNAQIMSGVETSYDKQIDFASQFSQNNVEINADMFVQSVNINTTSGNTSEWTVSKNEMEYVPGRFQMNIIQYPKVSIEYQGGISYFPESANPEFKGEQ